MQKIIPKRSVGGATQQQPSRIVRPLTQIPWHLTSPSCCHALPDMILVQTLELHQHSKMSAKIHQTQEQLTAFARP